MQHKIKRCYCREYRRGWNSKSLSHFWGLSNPEFTLGAYTYGSNSNTEHRRWFKTGCFPWSLLYLRISISGTCCKYHRPHSASVQLHGLKHTHTGWICCIKRAVVSNDSTHCSKARHFSKMAKTRTKKRTGVGYRVGGESGEQEITERLRHSLHTNGCQLSPYLWDTAN